MEGNKKQIIDFRDLDVYRSLYTLSKIILTKVIVKLPQEEKYDLIDRYEICCKQLTNLGKSWSKYHKQ